MSHKSDFVNNVVKAARRSLNGAQGEVARFKQRQAAVPAHHEEALAALRRELELIASGPVTWVAHAPGASKPRQLRISA